MAVLSYIRIEKFRQIPPGKISIGSAVTAIAGYNATFKSTLLGMIGQGFGKKGTGFTDIFGNHMGTDFSELFKMGVNDEPGEHLYHLGLNKEFPPHGSEAQVRSRPRGGTCRLVTGRLHEAGWGNLPVPVIYLGLKRLYPLGELKGSDDIKPLQATLTPEEDAFCKNWYEIMTAEKGATDIETLISQKTKTKQTLAFPTNTYDSSVISAGQDNIGKILAAIISFWRIKRERPEEYPGGLLIIDEVDAALHPSAQRRLLDLFIIARIRFGIQTIVTTHSLSFLDYFFHYKTNEREIKNFLKNQNGAALQPVYLYRSRGSVTLKQAPAWDFILSNLQDTIAKYEPSAAAKKTVYTEDPEARYLIQLLIPKTLRGKMKMSTERLGKDALFTMAKIPLLQNYIFIADGDNRKARSPKNYLCLPGNKSPERELYAFMTELPEENDLWTEDFDKRKFLANAPANNDRDTMKAWFEDLLLAPGKPIMKKFILSWAQTPPVKTQLLDLQAKLAALLE